MSNLKRHKVSELIKSLQYMKDTYGDLPVNISTNKQQASEKIYIGYDQFEDKGDEISISDFPF